MNPFQINAVFGMPSETAFKYLDYIIGGLEYDYDSNSIINNARTFRIANLSRLDIAQDILNGLKDSLQNRTGVKGFQKELATILKRKGWWDTDEIIDPKTGEVIAVKNGTLSGSSSRLKTIYDNMISTMTSVGRYIEMNKSAFAYPYWQYHAVLDMRTRDEHGKLNGKIFRYDDPIWDVIYPPNGFNCRCSVSSLSDDDIKGKNLTVLSSQGHSYYDVVDYVDENGVPVMKRVKGAIFTDEHGKEITIYPDKGFDRNPARGFFNVNLDNYNTELARKYVEAELNSPVLDMMYKNGLNGTASQDMMNVAVLSDAEKDSFSVDTKTLTLSQESLNQIISNKSIDFSSVKMLQNLIIQAPTILSDKNGLYFCTKTDIGWSVVGVNFNGQVKTMGLFNEMQMTILKKMTVAIRDE